MKSPNLTPYDPAEYLDTEEKQRLFLEAALEENDAEYFAHAVGIVIRARGASLVARETGLARASLYKSFREGGNPEFGTVLRVLHALGIDLKLSPSQPAGTAA
jgi:probable addiction module antidote protein